MFLIYQPRIKLLINQPSQFSGIKGLVRWRLNWVKKIFLLRLKKSEIYKLGLYV